MSPALTIDRTNAPAVNNRLFGECSDVLMKKLENVAESKEAVDMETLFCSVSLDIIGKAVFNYPFDSVTQESPVIKVRTVHAYTHMYIPCVSMFVRGHNQQTHSHTHTTAGGVQRPGGGRAPLHDAAALLEPALREPPRSAPPQVQRESLVRERVKA